jgi:hypothetical protein
MNPSHGWQRWHEVSRQGAHAGGGVSQMRRDLDARRLRQRVAAVCAWTFLAALVVGFASVLCR